MGSQAPSHGFVHGERGTGGAERRRGRLAPAACTGLCTQGARTGWIVQGARVEQCARGGLHRRCARGPVHPTSLFFFFLVPDPAGIGLPGEHTGVAGHSGVLPNHPRAPRGAATAASLHPPGASDGPADKKGLESRPLPVDVPLSGRTNGPGTAAVVLLKDFPSPRTSRPSWNNSPAGLAKILVAN